MKAKRVSREDQLKFIMECRASVLSDYQWCEKQGIHPGTFYNWVSKLKKAGVTVPDSESKHVGSPVHQEVVNGTPALIKGSYISSSLLANIAYQKYGLYLPLYRQDADFAQMNAPINRATMIHWLVTASKDYLQSMYDYFHRKLLERRFLMLDETPTQVLKEDGRREESKSYF